MTSVDGGWDPDDEVGRPAPWFRRPLARWLALLVAASLLLSQIIGRFG